MTKNCELAENQKSILVLDSGNGGLYTLNILKKNLPNENFIFVKDERNSPYGNKSKLKLKKLSKKLISFLLEKYKIKMIILACNTLSSTAFSYLKNNFQNLPIIPIYPVVKSFKKKTLILCTNSTKKHCAELKKVRKNSNVKIYGFSRLAKKIDENIKNLSVLQPFLNKKLKKFAKMHIRQVVLGCTHFNFIKPQIEKALLQNYDKNKDDITEKKYVKVSFQNKENCNQKGNKNLRIFRLNKDKISFIEGSVDLARKVQKILEVLSIKNHQKGLPSLILLNTKTEFFDTCYN